MKNFKLYFEHYLEEELGIRDYKERKRKGDFSLEDRKKIEK